MRNVAVDDVDRPGCAVVAIRTDYPPRHLLPMHQHRRAQLLYSATGVMQVDTIDGSWTVPTHRAVLIPPNTDHQVAMEDVSTRSLFLEPSAAPWFPIRCQVVDVSALLRELLLAAVDLPADYRPRGRDGALVDLILYELQAVTPLPFDLPMPSQGTLLEHCRMFATAPSIRETPQQWSSRLGLSTRTFNRTFRAETGLTFQQWRQRACILHAIRLLSRGNSVTQTATRLGYGTPAAFSAMFGKHTGAPPNSFQ
ncbi:AraC family transcriptional regulator [Mycobacterium spongiae]|uniref:Helix-turn-helix domain-containing protein n=1 Tax=Mycobacterium spongiae TaxID=886343 RepID=A0A975PZ49_9MYCO|nr:helix-turn-helix transcriptional regulator [Mycobacterium spongiae]QUR69463.1 helix-turn-helix domain-containing protein [Mycobacterium spongiae]